MNHHIIYKQKATVTVAKESNAYSLQKEIGDVIKNELPQLLQEVFDSISPNGDIIRIDTLQIDTGILPVQNTGQLFKERVIEKIREAVAKKKENAAMETGVSQISKEQSLRESFLYFLDHGVKPWYMSDRKKEDWESRMQQYFDNNDWKNIVDWLQQNQYKPVIIERLTYQFSNDFLDKLISYMLPFGKEEWNLIYQDLTAFFTWVETDKKTSALQHEVFIRSLTAFLRHHQLPDALYEVVKTKFLATVHGDHFIAQQQMAAGENITTDIVRKTVERLAEEISHKLTNSEKKEKENATNKDVLLPHADEIINAETDVKKQRENNPSAELVEKEPQYVGNSGIVLLHPFLEMYFAEFGLMQQKKFINEEACKHAVLLLHYLATGETKVEEWNLLLQKIMCGFSFEETLPDRIELTEQEKEESEKLLQSVINYCPLLKNTSIAGLRSTFLQRDGRLEKKENGWLLTVEQKTVDVLLDKIPWGFSTIKFPWLSDMINVDWC